MKALAGCLSLTLGLITGASPGHAQLTGQTADAIVAARRVNVPYSDAAPILEALREGLIPAELTAGASAERTQFWPRWVSDRDRVIRARMTRGDEDSVFNFLLLGTTFTAARRVTNVVAALEDAAEARVVERRLDDLVAARGIAGRQRTRAIRP